MEDTFLRSVVTCKLEDPLSSAVKKMRDNSFSKLPVYQSETFVGLLTAEAITFWLADHISFNKDLSAERVEAVVRYMYDVEKYCFVARTSPLFEVLRIFDDYSHQGTRLQAILISADGSEQSELLGIITVFDLPKIYNIIDGK